MKKDKGIIALAVGVILLFIIILSIYISSQNNLVKWREERHKQLAIIENETGMRVISHTASGIKLVNMTSGKIIDYTVKVITREGKVVVNE